VICGHIEIKLRNGHGWVDIFVGVKMIALDRVITFYVLVLLLTAYRKSMAYGWGLNNLVIVYGGYRDDYIGDLWVTTEESRTTDTTTGVSSRSATTGLTVTTGSTITCAQSNCFCLQESFAVMNTTCNGDGTVVVEDHLEIASDVEIPAGAVLQVQGNLTVTGGSFKMNSKSNITILSHLIINSQSVLHIILAAPSKKTQIV
jgi:hypothetical protein